MAGKREITIAKEAAVKKLRILDQKYKFTTVWDGEVSRMFKETETFCFDETVKNNLDIVEQLINRWSK